MKQFFDIKELILSKSMRNRFLGPGEIFAKLITNMVHRFNFCSLYAYFEVKHIFPLIHLFHKHIGVQFSNNFF
jgi:hypothetical protein